MLQQQQQQMPGLQQYTPRQAVNDIPQVSTSSAIQSPITGIKLRLTCHTDGYFMQMQPAENRQSKLTRYTVHQLRGLEESYTALQGNNKYTPGLQLIINTNNIVPLDGNLALTIIPERSSVVFIVADHAQLVVFTIEPDVVYDHATKEITLS
jgi:hypothetical protein